LAILFALLSGLSLSRFFGSLALGRFLGGLPLSWFPLSSFLGDRLFSSLSLFHKKFFMFTLTTVDLLQKTILQKFFVVIITYIII